MSDFPIPDDWIDALKWKLAHEQADCPGHEFVDIGGHPFCRLCGYAKIHNVSFKNWTTGPST